MKLHEIISAEEISKRVGELAHQINQEYAQLTLLVILKGSFIFAADLLRCLTIPVKVEMIFCSSYDGTQRGEITCMNLDNIPAEGEDILLIDDILDSGATLRYVHQQLEPKRPRSLRSAALLSKGKAEEQIDHVLFTIPDQFVVGYGLDYNELYRNLPGIAVMEEDIS